MFRFLWIFRYPYIRKQSDLILKKKKKTRAMSWSLMIKYHLPCFKSVCKYMKETDIAETKAMWDKIIFVIRIFKRECTRKPGNLKGRCKVRCGTSLQFACRVNKGEPSNFMKILKKWDRRLSFTHWFSRALPLNNGLIRWCKYHMHPNSGLEAVASS